MLTAAEDVFLDLTFLHWHESDTGGLYSINYIKISFLQQNSL